MSFIGVVKLEPPKTTIVFAPLAVRVIAVCEKRPVGAEPVGFNRVHVPLVEYCHSVLKIEYESWTTSCNVNSHTKAIQNTQLTNMEKNLSTKQIIIAVQIGKRGADSADIASRRERQRGHIGQLPEARDTVPTPVSSIIFSE
jgi:hypothetical protein